MFGSGGVSPLTGEKTPGSESEGSALFDAIASGSNPQDMTEGDHSFSLMTAIPCLVLLCINNCENTFLLEVIEAPVKINEPFSISTSDGKLLILTVYIF